jgi:hypothetical protein
MVVVRTGQLPGVPGPSVAVPVIEALE